MIEELTPRLLSVLLLVAMAVVALLTLLFSTILLWLYRRAVSRYMALAGESNHIEADNPAEALVPKPVRGSSPVDLFFEPKGLARQYGAAGLVFALVYSVAAWFVYPHQLGITGSLLALVIYLWPVVIAVILMLPIDGKKALGAITFYLLLYGCLSLWAATIKDIPASSFGAITLPARSSATPWQMTKLWLVVNGLPTLLILLCFNRWVRAVAPLMLSFLTLAVCGLLLVLMVQFSKGGAEEVVALAVSTGIDVRLWVLVILLLGLVVFAALGWGLARWIAAAYQHKRISDLTLSMDALWLLFASWYGMWLILGGLVWCLTAIVAFGGYKLTLFWLRRNGRKSSPGRGLIFLRVFALGWRTDELLNGLAGYWRHFGSILMITGPDVARSTVAPQQFLDFISGKLGGHFVRDQASLTRAVEGCDHIRDPDGRFRINSFFCHEDTWQGVFHALVGKEALVLMDLRSLSAQNAGCLTELTYLVAHVSPTHCVLIYQDEETLEYLTGTLAELCQARAKSTEQWLASLYRFDGSHQGIRAVMTRLWQ